MSSWITVLWDLNPGPEGTLNGEGTEDLNGLFTGQSTFIDSRINEEKKKQSWFQGLKVVPGWCTIRDGDWIGYKWFGSEKS